MNIVFLCRLYKPHIGGVEKHVEEISKLLSQHHSITIITEQHDPKIPLEEIYPEAKVYRLPVSNISEKNKKWPIWQWVWHNRQLLSNAEIVHIHDVFYWLIPIIPFLIKPKLFITFHGYEGSKRPGFKQILSHKLAEWLTIGNICIGDFHKKWYFTNPNVVSYGAVSEISAPSYTKTSKAIYFGRLATDTGILDYVKAANQSKINLDIFGEGPLLSKAKNMTAKNAFIKYKGFIPNVINIIPHYKYAFVSRYLSILEALKAKMPVVAHYDSVIKYDYLKMAPFSDYIYLVSNPQEIISACEEIKHNPDSAKSKITKGYNWVKGQTWDKLVDQYMFLWNEQK